MLQMVNRIDEDFAMANAYFSSSSGGHGIGLDEELGARWEGTEAYSYFVRAASSPWPVCGY
jgi:hypothetical protein